jgi:DNA repair exonuclease SbcCD ATPase subunit
MAPNGNDGTALHVAFDKGGIGLQRDFPWVHPMWPAAVPGSVHWAENLNIVTARHPVERLFCRMEKTYKIVRLRSAGSVTRNESIFAGTICLLKLNVKASPLTAEDDFESNPLPLYKIGMAQAAYTACKARQQEMRKNLIRLNSGEAKLEELPECVRQYCKDFKADSDSKKNLKRDIFAAGGKVRDCRTELAKLYNDLGAVQDELSEIDHKSTKGRAGFAKAVDETKKSQELQQEMKELEDQIEEKKKELNAFIGEGRNLHKSLRALEQKQVGLMKGLEKIQIMPVSGGERQVVRVAAGSAADKQVKGVDVI